MRSEINSLEEKMYPINNNEDPWSLERTRIDDSDSKFARLVFLGSNKQFETLSYQILLVSFCAIAQIFDNTHEDGDFCKEEHVARYAASIDKGDLLIVVLRSVNSEKVRGFQRACFKLFDYIEENIKLKPKENSKGLPYDLSKPVMQTIINSDNLSAFVKDPIRFYLNEQKKLSGVHTPELMTD